MKKLGFTLAEVLISVSIIGVIAMLMLPIVSKYKPDENKVRYLQAYNNLMEIMPVIASNREAYPLMNYDDNVLYNESPFLNTSAEVMIDGTKYSGVQKFCRLLATGFNTTGSINCTSEYDSSAEPIFKPSFETINGAQYMVQSFKDGTKYNTDIFIDVNGDKGQNCFATSATCTEVDRFKLIVGADGTIYVADKRGHYYLDTRTTWKKNNDIKDFAALETKSLVAKVELIPEYAVIPTPKEPEPIPVYTPTTTTTTKTSSTYTPTTTTKPKTTSTSTSTTTTKPKTTSTSTPTTTKTSSTNTPTTTNTKTSSTPTTTTTKTTNTSTSNVSGERSGGAHKTATGIGGNFKGNKYFEKQDDPGAGSYGTVY